MTALGLQYKFLDAVSLTTLSDEIYERLKNTWERPMRKAEVCCFLSHKQAWEQIVASNQPTLVLEDDAVLSAHAPALLDAIAKMDASFDMIVLETRDRKKIVGRVRLPLNSDFSLRALYQDRTGSAAYVLTPAGAKKLQAKANKGIAANADAFISSLYSLIACQVEPAAAIQLDMCETYGYAPPLRTSTTIGSIERPAVISGKWRFKFRRIAGQIRIALRILSVLHKAERIHIEPLNRLL